MLRCWACDHPFRRKMVLRDSLIRGRLAADGGPYRLYRCPRCNKESKVEGSSRGAFFASPAKEISSLEYLFSWIRPLNPSDFLRIARWHRLHGERRRHFFEREGDSRYSRWGLRGLLGILFGRREPEQGARGRAADSTQAGSGGASPRTPLPHPYRVLGVRLDADEETIREAFRRLAKQWHPDKQGSDDPRVLREAERRLRELLRAYEALEKGDAGS